MNAHSLVVLGIAERATYVRDGQTNLYKWNVLGLKHILLSHIFPLSLSGFLGLAFRQGALGQLPAIHIRDEVGVAVGTIGITTEESIGPPDAGNASGDGPILISPLQGWTTLFVPLDSASQMIITHPGTYLLFGQEADGTEEIIGQFRVVLLEPPPLTLERITAIRSDPNAAKAVRVEVGCRKCPSKLRVYAALDRNYPGEAAGLTWYQDVPDEYRCGCGEAVHDLRIMKRNLPGLLGTAIGTRSAEIRFDRLYEQSALASLVTNFRGLLASSPAEESIQIFLQNNPLVLHQFPADQIFFKPPILTFFHADFAIVTPQKELILVEIEKADLRLLKKDGGETSQLGHAFDQVRSWLHTADEHRLAILDSLGIKREAVSTIKGVVIAGRDAGNDPAHLRRLKGVDRGRVVLLTYDDLAWGLAGLEQRMSTL